MTRVRIEAYVAARDLDAALAKVRPWWASVVGAGPALEAWITRFLAGTEDDGVRASAEGAPTVAWRSESRAVAPITLLWTPAAVEELDGPQLEVGLVFDLPLESEGGPADEAATLVAEDESARGQDCWFGAEDARALWALMLALHEALPSAPIYLCREENEGEAWLSLVADDDECWAFDAAILPRAIATKMGRSPAWFERTALLSALGFADEARFTCPPWER